MWSVRSNSNLYSSQKSQVVLIILQVVIPDLYLLAIPPVHVLTPFRRMKEYIKGLKRRN